MDDDNSEDEDFIMDTSGQAVTSIMKMMKWKIWIQLLIQQLYHLKMAHYEKKAQILQ